MAKQNVKKNAQGYGYKYTDLAEINTYIESIHGTYYQYTKTDEADHECYIWTHRLKDDIIDHDIEVRGCRIVRAALSGGKQNEAQALGAATTYSRRYSLELAYGLATTDDDAESLTVSGSYTAPAGMNVKPQTYRQQLLDLANMNGINLGDIQAQYGLVPKDTEEHYKRAYEQLKKDLEA